jgi:DNA polymerase I-like protein with 3'-5' exonuclease and polymerase domains
MVSGKTMIKQGAFIDRHGNRHDVHIVEDKNFYRLDIVKPQAVFNVDLEAMEFSIIRKRRTFTYGDRDLYEDFNALLGMSAAIKCTTEKTSEWILGEYVSRHTKVNNESDFAEELVYSNGVLNSVKVMCKERFLLITLVSNYGGVKIEPLNFYRYTESILGEEGAASALEAYYPLATLEAKYDLTHLKNKDTCVADSIDCARERLRAYDNAGEVLRGFDTETTGLDVDMYGEDKLVGIVLSYNENEATYYPFRHTKTDNLPIEFLDELVAVVIKHQSRTIAHNKKFDRKVMLKEGYDVRIKYDTLVLSFMVNPVIARGEHVLKNIVFETDGNKYLELSDIFTTSGAIDFGVLPKDIVKAYACPDGYNLIVVFKYLYEKLPKYTRNLYDIETDLADIKADQEFYGLRVDVSKFVESMDNCKFVLDLLEKAFRQLTRIDGNIDSTFVISDLIYNKMSCPVLKRTKTGKPATTLSVIRKLAKASTDNVRDMTTDMTDKKGNVIVKAADLNKSKYPALVILEKYRIYRKLFTSFYSRFERTIERGRVFFWINQNGAASGRQSSPMHQLPPDLKEIILSDSEDHEMWDPDYSQMELRMIAYLAGEKDLIEMCKDPDNDIHRVIGSLITGLEMWEISSEMRKRDKTRNFGVVYLISKYGLADQMFGAGASMKKEYLDIAEQSLNEFYNRFKRIRKYVADNAVLVKRDGFITTRFGRTRYFKEILDPDLSSSKRASLIRQANNTPVQGSAADYMKIAEVNFDTYIRSKGWNKIMPNGFPYVRIALSIHDEILLMANKAIPYEELLLMIRECMEIPVEGAPPFFCSPAKVDNWEQHDDDSVVVSVKLRDKLISDYQKTGVSVINKENYTQLLNDYREGLLNGYMHSLIEKHGDNVAEFVKHPTLTHSLLDRYPPPKHTKPDHKEHIKYAADLYLKGTEKQNIVEIERKEAVFPDYSALVNFDETGEVVFDQWDDEDGDDLEDTAESATELESVKVWELGDALCIDTSALEVSEVNSILQELWKYREADGFYKVFILYGEAMRDVGFRVEDIPKSLFNDMIKEFEDGRNETGRGV